MRSLFLLPLFLVAAWMFSAEPAPPPTNTVRVATCQAQGRVIDWRITSPAEVLAAVDKNLDELEKIIDKAGQQKCDVVTLPEDTLGLLNWYSANEQLARQVLPEGVKHMLDRLGRAAARHRMYLVVCSDNIEADGGTYNTAFFLGRDGKEIGRYHKTCPTWSESGSRQRGKAFPVFDTPDLGTVGMLICYDLVVPETARCLALQGADIIFFPTMGGAAVGDGDIGLQALRVRAAENRVYLVVAFRSSGSMIISPQGKILATAEGTDGLAIADIDPRGCREGGDSSNHQRDMRARLFRERNPEAFRILTEPNPPVLAKVPIDMTREEAGRIFARMLTVGPEELKQAEALASAGKTKEAIAAFEKLRTEYRGTWIDRVAQERLAILRADADPESGLKNQDCVRFFVDPRTNSDDPEQRMAYGLNVAPPWAEGGSVFINLPEHLEYMPGTLGIARHHDVRRNVWQIASEGAEASYAVESLSEPGVFFSVRARAVNDRALFEMSITNRSAKTLKSIRPMLCFQYDTLNRFPKAHSDNFLHTFVVIGGQPVSIDSLPVKTPEAPARMAQVAGCADEHNWWAEKIGGMIERRLDSALTILTVSEGDRKIAVSWRPGKNLLSNRAIPCIHADPCIGDLAPGESRTVQGELLFTHATLEQIVSEATARQGL